MRHDLHDGLIGTRDQRFIAKQKPGPQQCSGEQSVVIADEGVVLRRVFGKGAALKDRLRDARPQRFGEAIAQFLRDGPQRIHDRERDAMILRIRSNRVERAIEMLAFDGGLDPTSNPIEQLAAVEIDVSVERMRVQPCEWNEPRLQQDDREVAKLP